MHELSVLAITIVYGIILPQLLKVAMIMLEVNKINIKFEHQCSHSMTVNLQAIFFRKRKQQPALENKDITCVL